MYTWTYRICVYLFHHERCYTFMFPCSWVIQARIHIILPVSRDMTTKSGRWSVLRPVTNARPSEVACYVFIIPGNIILYNLSRAIIGLTLPLIRLTDRFSVSRKHCEIYCESNQLMSIKKKTIPRRWLFVFIFNRLHN